MKRYEKELEGHIIKIGRTQYLGDEAVAFLDEKRKQNPVVVIQQDKDEELELLKNENKQLLLRINKLQEELLAEKDKNALLQEREIARLEAPAADETAVTVEQPAKKAGIADRVKFLFTGQLSKE